MLIWGGHQPIIVDISHRQDAVRIQGDTTPTLTARAGTGGNNVPVTLSRLSYSDVREDQKAACIKAEGGPNWGGAVRTLSLTRTVNRMSELLVRKLTPLECERLQGLPDNWTLIDDKTCSDSARYKAIGNGMAQPCADFVLRRIVLHETR